VEDREEAAEVTDEEGEEDEVEAAASVMMVRLTRL
jgi:hypothetical protein